jgi:hypothetical protein
MRKLFSLLLLCGCLAMLPGEGGRDFAGQYSIANVVESGETVNATFAVRLLNYSGRDVSGARLLLLQDAPPMHESLLAVNLDLAYRSHTVIRAEIVAPAREFERWKQGGQPRLALEIAGEDGLVRRHPVELMRDLVPARVGEEEK